MKQSQGFEDWKGHYIQWLSLPHCGNLTQRKELVSYLSCIGTMRIVPINIISSYVPTLSERDLDFLIEIFHNYHTGYLRLPMWGVISNCLYSSGNVNPFSSCVSGSALVMIFANTSSCIFQFQNLKLLSVSRRHSVKQHN